MESIMQSTIHSRIQQQLIEKVSTQRVTIVVGPTGCGKSTQVPLILLENLGHPILISQPRRLAVVSLATRVASQLSTPLGETVGYQVGQTNTSKPKTKLTFCTAGILLEQLRSNGMRALTKFKCILIDECHERSRESDLCLVLIKSFMCRYPKQDLRLVLMSATFHQEKYKEFFVGVPGCERVDTVSIQSAESVSAWYENVETLYLEDIMNLLGTSGRYNHYELYNIMCMKPDKDLYDSDVFGKNISDRMLRLIHSLITHLDQIEPKNAVFLLFAPTYRHLEQCYELLGNYDINVLHSSIDIQHCLESMSTTSSNRKIFLASAIADSSVTIPGVTCVIDLCRALEMKWDCKREKYNAKTVWATQSICDQRRGRTGRTCPGRVFRLLTQSFYINNLQPFDVPDLVHSSCRNEVLQLLSSSTPIMSDPSSILNRCLDPPPDEAVSQAIHYLEEIGACKKGKRKLFPTDYGRLLSAFPLDVSDSRSIITGGTLGILHEIIALKVITSCRPFPIVHHFADESANERNLKKFYPNVDQTHTSIVLANLSAYMYWNATWNIEHTKHARWRFARITIVDNVNVAHDGNVWEWSDQMEEQHAAWCKQHEINPSSVRAVSDTIDIIMNILYSTKHEPEWLRCNDSTPIWRKPRNNWRGNGQYSEFSMFETLYGERDAELLTKALTQLCRKDGDPSNQAAKYALEIVEENGYSHQFTNKIPKKDPPACIYFLQGHCVYGDKCKSSHNLGAKRPTCVFYNQGHCMKGDDCPFLHEYDDDDSYDNIDEGFISTAPILPSKELNSTSSLSWFQNHSKHLMLLGEGNFTFAMSLNNLNSTVSVASCINSTIMNAPNTIKFCKDLFFNIDATRIHTNSFIKLYIQNGKIQSFAWNFPHAINDDDGSNESLLSGTFLSLATLMNNGAERSFQFGITLHRDQFSRWNVHRSAFRSGFELLEWSCISDVKEDFPNYVPCMNDGEVIHTIEDARFFLFGYTRR